jgi:hypothetical protein
MDNDALEASDLDEVKEDLEYYLTCTGEPDFAETALGQDPYEALDLDTLGAQQLALAHTAPAASAVAGVGLSGAGVVSGDSDE